MSTMDKNDVIIELKKLQGHLEDQFEAEERIRQCQYDLNTLDRRLEAEKDVRLAPTDRYTEKKAEYLKKQSITLSFPLILTIIGVGFIAVCALVYGLMNLFVKNDDWSVSELLRKYEGNYYMQYSDPLKYTLEFTSCDEKGNVEGTIEFKDGDTVGKFYIYGNITERGDNGYLVIMIHPGSWIEQPFGYSLGDMEVEVYDNYNVVRATEEKMALYADGYNAPNDEFAWKYSGGELEECPQKTRVEQYSTSAIVIVILTYPVLAFFLFKLLSNVDIELLTPKQKKVLSDLRKQDQANAAKNKQAIERAEAKAEAERKRVIAQCNKDITIAKGQVAKAERLVAEITIIAPEDKTLRNVETLIHLLTSGRADTLKEARDKLDIQNNERKAKFERDMQVLEMNNMIKDALAKAESDQICHNFNVMQEKRKQTKELEEINKKLDEYRN